MNSAPCVMKTFVALADFSDTSGMNTVLENKLLHTDPPQRLAAITGRFFYSRNEEAFGRFFSGAVRVSPACQGFGSPQDKDAESGACGVGVYTPWREW